MRTKKWEIIELPAIDMLEFFSEEELSGMSLPAGFCIRFFRHDMHFLYTVASNYVKLTRGVLDYLQDYNQLGPNKSRNKLFICIQYDRNRECLNGPLCREVHCTIPLETVEDAALYNVPSNATGAPSIVKVLPGWEIREKKLNRALTTQTGDSASGAPGPGTALDEPETTPLDTLAASGSLVDVNGSTDSVIYLPSSTILRHSLHSRWTSKKMYRTFDSGVLFKVALPNTPTPVDTYDSGELFITKGALEYYEQCVRKETTTVTMQHCAHYSKNGICCFGEDCQFVHVLHYNPRERVENGDSLNSDVDQGSTASSERKTSRGKKFTNSKVAPLTVNQINKCFQNVDTLSSSHPSSSTQSTSSLSRGSRAAPQAASQPVNNLVFVPPSMMWVPLETTSNSLFSNQQGPLIVPPPMLSTPTPPLSNNMYMMTSGPNGEAYIVQQNPPVVPGPPQHMGTGGNLPQGSQQQQQMYMVPMRYS
ncbi:unnamed protein product [Phytomonas sp. EM1]|nr:unnamed protein product [Phytomonas sp. EM1]|eukprot:CCW61938.1 unnamed protein product [Phytomonas sp. isolate EM1]